MKIVGLIGEPASGKSTVFRKLIATLGGYSIQKQGLVTYTLYHDDKVIIAGIYDEQVFSGTDRLSKGCGPAYREWITQKNEGPDWDSWTFYWEGERFSNSKFFDFFRDECSDVTIYYLMADEATLNERNANRSNQNPSWRKGMATRMRNLKEGYSVEMVEQGFTLT
jgi:ABC-type dipeptide/oligopeptide/nickel transport system ATPase component